MLESPQFSIDWTAAPPDETHVRELSRACRAADGCRNLDDGLLWSHLEGRAQGYWEPEGRAYLGLDRQSETGRLQLLVHPQARGSGLGTALLRRALGRLSELGCASAQVWAYGDHERSRAWLVRHGFEAERVLYELRRPPDAVPAPDWPAGWRLSAFRPEQDEQTWHSLHQSLQSVPSRAWSLESLRRQLAEPATPAADFWLLWQEQALRGYLWLKAGSPPELFLFALDPGARGQGIGKRLLAWALSRGNGSALVYCDDQRAAALSLYRSFDFRETARDRCLRKTL